MITAVLFFAKSDSPLGPTVWGDLVKHGSGKCQLLGGIYLEEAEFGTRVGVEKGEQEGAHLYL